MSDTKAAVDRIERAATVLEQVANQLVQEIEDTFKTGNLVAVLTLFHALSDNYEKLDAARKLIYNITDHLNKNRVPSAIDDSGQDLVRIPSLARSFYPIQKYSASILKKDLGFQWLRANDGDGLIQNTVNAQSLAAFLRDFVKDTGKDPPDDIFKFTPYFVTGSSKYTPKEKL